MSNYYSTFQGRADVPTSGASDTVVPNVYLPSRVGKSINGQQRLVSIASSNGSSAAASGMMLFNIPSNLGYLKPNSVYLKFQFTATTTAAVAYGFNFGNSRSVASVFNRVSLSNGSQPIEVINNYNVFQDLLLSHTTSKDYVSNDASITEGTTRVTLASGTEYFFTVPIASSVLQNAKAFPLWMTANGLTLQIDLETAARAVFSGTGYTITNPILCCDVFQPDEAFLMTLKNEMLTTNKLYEIPLVQCQSLLTSRTATTDLSYLAGLNLSSVLSVFWGEITTTVDQGSNQKVVINPMSVINDSVSYDRQLLIDGTKKNSYAIQSNAQVFQELQRCLRALTDGSQTSTVDVTTYATQSFWNGITCAKVNEYDAAMRGVPIGNFQLILNSNGQNPAGSNCYIFVVYDSVLVISPATGAVVVAK